MNSTIFHLVCFYILLLSSSIFFHYAHQVSSSKLFGNDTDQLALLSFKKEIISDPLSITSSWNESVHFCNWIGITCGRKHDQRVIAMDLRSSRLVGTLSPAVGNLTFLRQLRLDNNSFTGQIPQEIGKLSRLQILVLRNNSFSGEIPRNISRCLKLIMLHLGRNKLKGNIPVEFSSLNKLEEMHVFFNNLSGEIPSCFSNFSSIQLISLTKNNFHGTIPDFIGKLEKLEVLELAQNNLSGDIPASIFNLSSLRNLELLINQFQGRLPSSMGFTLPRLEVFDLGANQLSGELPASVSNLTNLLLFAVDTNKFSGEVPRFGNSKNLYWLGLGDNYLGKGRLDDLIFMSSLQNCSALQVLQLDENRFGGIIPTYFGNMSSLVYLTMSRNLIHGTIPVEISQLHSLQELSLGKNHLTGEIPDSIGELELLNELHLNENQFSGKIPSCIGNLTMLTKLNLGANNLYGSIPSSLGKIKFLSLLNLSMNHLSDDIAKEIFQLPEALLQLDLSSNQITGSLAPLNNSIRLKNLVYLSLSKNNFSGEIPNSFKTMTSLTELYVDHNDFQGAIPPSLSSLKSLEFIDLSHNKFVSKIPEFFTSIQSLKYLNLSYNDLEGELPSDGVFKNKSGVSITGNRKLCGGIPEFKLRKCSKNYPNSGKPSRTMILIISLVVGAIAVVIVVAVALLLSRKQRFTDHQSSTIMDAVIPRVTYQSLQKATNGFSAENLIGSGNFSSVYKGILDESVDGIMEIAIKVLKLQVKGAGKSFVAECEALRHIRHRNLVKLLTCCSSIDHQGHDFKAVIYEFMRNGNLHNWLHQSCWTNTTTVEENPKQPRTSLNIRQRLDIAIDVASVLDYLHNQSGTPLIHCDLKPSNVLLDEEFVAHLGDFGLSRFMQVDATHVVTSIQSNSSTIKGTLGYIPPEYATGSCKLSTYGDVYSYGIIVLETFTGKSPTDEIFKDGLNLHDFVKMAIPEQVMNVCDPTLLDLCLENENENVMEECLCSVFRIGIACSMELAEARMGIAHALKELHFIRETL